MTSEDDTTVSTQETSNTSKDIAQAASSSNGIKETNTAETAASVEKMKLDDAEARAIFEATTQSDLSYVPSPALLSNPSPLPLIRQVDGVDLKVYNGSPSVYQAKNIPVARRGRLDLPIYVTSGGSMVEYNIESDGYDIGFGITAERDDKETVVKDNERVDSQVAPITGKFLVGSVPCALVFIFDNEYSWVREKLISYKITICPPSKDIIMAGRRRRAASALKTLQEDKVSASSRLSKALAHKETLGADITRMEKELEEKKKNLEVASNEEDWLRKRVSCREEQEKMLNSRLQEGWEDEK